MGRVDGGEGGVGGGGGGGRRLAYGGAPASMAFRKSWGRLGKKGVWGRWGDNVVLPDQVW